MEKRYLHKIAELLKVSVKQAENVHQLHEEGATIPFMARYRKEATGNLDEVQINDIVEKIKYFDELQKRKETVIKTIEAAGKLTPELKSRIENSFEATEVEDIYLPFKPKRKTKATTAIEKGLEPLAAIIFAQNDIDVNSEAAKFINEQVTTNEDALQGARDIIAEWIAEHEQARNAVRHLYSSGAIVTSKVLKSKKEVEEAQKYRDYFEFSERLKDCPSHRMLAIRRGEKEGFLSMDITINEQEAKESLKNIFIKKQSKSTCHPEPPQAKKNDAPSHPEPPQAKKNDASCHPEPPQAKKNDASCHPEPPKAKKADTTCHPEPSVSEREGSQDQKFTSIANQMKLSIEDSYDRLLKSSIENEFRLQAKTAADEEAIRVFAENLRQLLLASPLGSKKVMALDPGFRTGCKLVCLDAQGNFKHYSTIYPHQPQMEVAAAVAEIKKLVEKFGIEAIGIGNGTAGRETEQLVRGIDFGKPVSVFMVNESGASIYSASEVAREEFPNEDVTVRGAISIGRRLLDPLSELVKIDAKSIGVGQYQHDVNQVRLKEQLDKVVESCVNHVGVDVNTASRHLLGYISGLSTTLAKNIVDYRSKNGPFSSRDEIRKVPLMGPKSFEQSAGFMRIPGAGNPLDNSAVHPESYHVVQAMAKDLGCTVNDLITDPSFRKQVAPKKYVSETIGEFTINDILKELEKPGRDPRAVAEEFRFDDTIKSIEDVKVGMKVPGIVTNITNFGAFVDIGVKQDGLLHISQMSNTYISDPNQVVKLQQRLMVTVTEVDVARKRISLSMKDAAQAARPAVPKAAVPKAALQKPGAPKKEEPVNDFQAKLMELKKKFK